MKRNINQIDDDIIRKKRIIGEMLYSDPDIIEVLEGKESDKCPDEYMYTHIYPFIRIPGVQDTAKSYITFMLDDMDLASTNKSMKSQYLKVVIFVHKDLVQTKWGAERHDLLAYLIRDVFHLSNKLGLQLNLISNREGVTDNNYCTREMRFEMITLNGVQPFNTNKYERDSIVYNHNKRVKHEPIC